MSWSKRNISVAHSDSPLTSKRVRVILSNPTDASKLAKAIRAKRHNKDEPFKLSQESERLLKKE